MICGEEDVTPPCLAYSPHTPTSAVTDLTFMVGQVDNRYEKARHDKGVGPRSWHPFPEKVHFLRKQLPSSYIGTNYVNTGDYHRCRQMRWGQAEWLRQKHTQLLPPPTTRVASLLLMVVLHVRGGDLGWTLVSAILKPFLIIINTLADAFRPYTTTTSFRPVVLHSKTFRTVADPPLLFLTARIRVSWIFEHSLQYDRHFRHSLLTSISSISANIRLMFQQTHTSRTIAMLIFDHNQPTFLCRCFTQLERLFK
jgi:hypothetical protein